MGACPAHLKNSKEPSAAGASEQGGEQEERRSERWQEVMDHVGLCSHRKDFGFSMARDGSCCKALSQGETLRVLF